jgi:hypothetical protein
MAIHNFTGDFDMLRLWNMGDRVPGQVTIYASTDDNNGSLTTSDYIPLQTAYLEWNLSGYADIPVHALNGSRSLLLKFGPGSNASGAQITEIQAFLAPEPSNLILVITGLCAVLACSWRKRRHAQVS